MYVIRRDNENLTFDVASIAKTPREVVNSEVVVATPQPVGG